MVKRFPIKCETCEQGLILRLGMGEQKVQVFNIACPNCKQKISIIMEFDKSIKQKITINEVIDGYSLKSFFNAVPVKEEDEFITFNLHAEMVYPKYLLHDKLQLPSVIVSPLMMAHARQKGIITEEDELQHKKKSKYLSVFDFLGGDGNLLEDWSIIKKAWNLHKSNLNELVQKELKNYTNYSNLANNGKDIYNIIFDFFYRFILPNKNLYLNIENEFEKARKLNNNEMKIFIDYYKENLKDLFFENYIEIFDEYFNNFQEFNRVLLNNKINLHPEKDSESILCPINFNDVKMYYGNAYEFFTSHILTLVCTNNILNNRKFNEFEHMTFNKYLKDVTKEKKSKPLENNNTFKSFTNILESTIRNASHHKWFYIDKNSPGHLQYKSGGTGALRQMSYIDYLYKSNEITMSLSTLLMIEIYLIEY